MTNLMIASNQWATRPDDQRFLDLASLAESVRNRRRHSTEVGVALEHLTVRARDDGEMTLMARPDLPDLGVDYDIDSILTNWTFGQLCSRAKAHAPYLRTLPSEIAQIPLAWSLENADRDDGKLLLTSRNGDGRSLRAITSQKYGRIWDIEVVEAVRSHINLDEWKVPSASYQATDPKQATTLYASDRDIFLFMVNESKPIEINGSKLNRGFIVWNSEVGKTSLGIMGFLYDFICDNRIIWGAQNVQEIRIRHTAGGPMRFAREAQPALQQYLESSAQQTIEMVKITQAKEVGKDKDSVIAWMRSRGFSRPVASAAYARAENDDRNLNPRSVWGIVQGLTGEAHEIDHTDRRIEIETQAGKLLEMAAA